MRKPNKGIFFYPMEVDHHTNKRLRLLFVDHDSDGYYIWSNILCYAYKINGYYFPVTKDDVEGLAADCRKSPELIEEVINSCVKRGLFEKDIFDKFQVLTNDRMQINYLRATYENRRKGSIIFFEENYYAINHDDLAQLSEKFLINSIFRQSGKYLQKLLTERGQISELFDNSAEKDSNSAEKDSNSAEKRDRSEHKEKESKVKEKYLASHDAPVGAKNGVVGVVKNSHQNGVKKIGQNSKKTPPKKESKIEVRVFNEIKILWWEWYRGRNENQNPKFDGASGSAIQKLSAFFISGARSRKIELDDEIFKSSVAQFKHILNHWEELKSNKFLYSSVDIKKINSNINDIINFFKNGRSHQQVPPANTGRNTKSSGAEKLTGLLKDEIRNDIGGAKGS